MIEAWSGHGGVRVTFGVNVRDAEYRLAPPCGAFDGYFRVVTAERLRCRVPR